MKDFGVYVPGPFSWTWRNNRRMLIEIMPEFYNVPARLDRVEVPRFGVGSSEPFNQRGDSLLCFG